MKAILVVLTLCLANSMAQTLTCVDLIKFELYTPTNKHTPQYITVENAHQNLTNFNPSFPLRMIIHGWNSAPNGDSVIIKNEFLRCKNFNVIVVDWSDCAKTVAYSDLRNNVDLIAEPMTELLEHLDGIGYIDLSETIITGHSLGAHLAGYIGVTLGNDASAKRRLGTVVGMDPAALEFTSNTLFRMSSTDARQVLNIVTSAVGLQMELGSLNFFPNYGNMQPACGLNIACSHATAQLYYAEAINKNVMAYLCDFGTIGFKGIWYTCPTKTTTPQVQFGGEPLNPTSTGTYFLAPSNNSTGQLFVNAPNLCPLN